MKCICPTCGNEHEEEDENEFTKAKKQMDRWINPDDEDINKLW